MALFFYCILWHRWEEPSFHLLLVKITLGLAQVGPANNLPVFFFAPGPLVVLVGRLAASPAPGKWWTLFCPVITVIPFAASTWLRNGPVSRPGEGDEGVGILTTQQGELLGGH